MSMLARLLKLFGALRIVERAEDLEPENSQIGICGALPPLPSAASNKPAAAAPWAPTRSAGATG